MGTNQYDIQKKQMKAQAKETRRQAGIAYKSGMEQAQGVTEDSNASLAQAVSLLGKTGSLGVSSDAKNLQDISTGVDTGSLKGDTYKNLEADFPEQGGFKEVVEDGLLSGSLHGGVKKEIADRKAFAVIGKGLDEIGDISTGTVGDLTSGSTALNLKTFQDKLTKARNRYVNQVQEDVYSALMSAENADAQANLAGSASGWQTLNTIFDYGTAAVKIVGMI